MDALAGSPFGWFCAGVTVLFGVTALCVAKRSPVEKANVLVWRLLPVLLGLLCVATLGAAGGLVVFCGTCLVSSAYLGSGALLPVGDKAVLVTGKVQQTRSGKQKIKPTRLFLQVGWKTLCPRVRYV